MQAEDIIKITRFTLAVYMVDDPRKGLLEGQFDRLTTKKVRSFPSLPPWSPGTSIIQFRKSVHMHIGAYIWGRACAADFNPPDMCSPRKDDKKWTVRWSILGQRPLNQRTQTFTVAVRRNMAVSGKKIFVGKSIHVVRQACIACYHANVGEGVYRLQLHRTIVKRLGDNQISFSPWVW